MNRLDHIVKQLQPQQLQSSPQQLSSLNTHGTTTGIQDASVIGSEIIAKVMREPIYASISQHVDEKKFDLRGKTIFITGASRGIGLAIALRAARAGANIVVAAKTITEDPRLPGTIYTAAAEIEAAGGKALALQLDIRDESAVQKAIAAAVTRFGGIDILINNASAISLTSTEDTSMKKYDLMHSINTRGTFMMTKYALPHLKESGEKGRNPHVVNLGPPLNMEERWFAPHCAYTMAKFGMSMLVLGQSGENREHGIAFNSLWPLTIVATAAVQNLLGGSDSIDRSRTPEIMADSAYVILTSDATKVSGNYFVDEALLRATGVKDFAKYRMNPSIKSDDELGLDFFV